MAETTHEPAHHSPHLHAMSKWVNLTPDSRSNELWTHLGNRKSAPKFQLHEIRWVAVSSTARRHVERRHHLQSVCLQDVVLVNQTDENRLGPSMGCKVDAVALTNQTFHLFGPLKQHLGGKHFADDDDVQHELLLWMRQ
ncbi:hypothetical protein AVEN_258873-1 [Araneus ventricosus]|uniref:Uncharacterized protein n=1 Tax=Araneus ventricosus TaxID=182803 RepID=A0A4Y2I7U5_ARAVE|nr:hypothetical protein AVEN_258873-1 [Araneus ventricosus]